MDDKFYDSKGIAHGSEAGMENANRHYLEEEKRFKNEQLESLRRTESQVKQQREIAEAVARRQAEADRQQYEHQREIERHEKARLDELKRQGAVSQQDSEFNRFLAFLKDSDDDARLEAVLEWFLSKLSINYEKTPEQLHGEKQRIRADILGLFYAVPSLPPLCQPNGKLTQAIREAAKSTQSSSQFLSPAAYPLLQQLGALQAAISSYEQKRKNVGLIGHIFGSSELKNLDADLEIARLQLESLRPELAAFQQAAESMLRASKIATVELWIAAYRNWLIKGFFDQGLWKEAKFADRLKSVLKEIQKPIPTSFRASVENLSRQQIETVYAVFVKELANEWAGYHLTRGTTLIKRPLFKALTGNPDCGDLKNMERLHIDKRSLDPYESCGMLEKGIDEPGIAAQSAIILDILLKGPSHIPVPSYEKMANDKQRSGPPPIPHAGNLRNGITPPPLPSNR